MPKFSRWWILKPLVFLACLGPTLWLVYLGLTGGLGANPFDKIIKFTGDWTIRLLLITLAITPLRRISGIASLIRFRRMIGLFAFFQALTHVATYVVDKEFFWNEIVKDITQRPFILSGMIALTMMLPLAITSTRKWIARLGGSRWQAVHRLIYVSGIAAVIHYYFNEKSDIRDRLIYIGILAILLGFRAVYTLRRNAAPSKLPISS
jgi:methionine sulfoxide reductase heme-binding subunit